MTCVYRVKFDGEVMFFYERELGHRDVECVKERYGVVFKGTRRTTRINKTTVDYLFEKKREAGR